MYCKLTTTNVTELLLLLLLLLSLSSSLCRVFTIKYLKLTMFLGYTCTVLQLLWIYVQSVLQVMLFRPSHLFCTFTWALSVVCEQFIIIIIISHHCSLYPMQRKLLGIINVDFDTTSQLLTIYSAFVKYLRKNWNTTKQYISSLQTSRKLMIQLGRRSCITFSLSLVSLWNWSG